MYAEEGVVAPHIEYHDNAACVQLVESRPSGLIWLLEDTRKAKSSDTSFVDRAFAEHASHAHLLQPSRAGRRSSSVSGFAPRDQPGSEAPRFAISHFAGTVEYESTAFVHKNSDAVHAELPLLLDGRCGLACSKR